MRLIHQGESASVQVSVLAWFYLLKGNKNTSDGWHQYDLLQSRIGVA